MILINLPFENNDITAGKIMAGLLGLFVYFIPAVIARDKSVFKRVLLLNLLTGWTFVGWMIAFVWALKAAGPPVLKQEKKKKKKKKNPGQADL